MLFCYGFYISFNLLTEFLKGYGLEYAAAESCRYELLFGDVVGRRQYQYGDGA